MNCHEFRRRLPDLLYTELNRDDRDALEDHRGRCSSCREEERALRRTMGALDRWPPIESPVNAPELVPVPRPSDSWTRIYLAGSVSGLAAALVLGFLLVTLWGTTEVTGGRVVLTLGSATPEETAPPPRDEFLLLLIEPPSAVMNLSPRETQRIVEEYGDWARDLGTQGALVSGEKLQDEVGWTLRQKEGETTVIARVDREIDDTIGGYFRIRAESAQEALRLARTCPHLKYGRKIELRPIERP